MYTLHQTRSSLAYEQRGTWWMLVDWMSMRLRMYRWLWMLLVLYRVMMVWINGQVTRCRGLSLVSWRVASLRLLYLPGGQLHVGVPHPLLVQLILGPEQHLQTDSQLALCVVSMFSHENSSIELTGNLLSVSW